MSARATSRLAWSMWALAVTLTTVSLLLLVLIRSHPGTHIFDWWLGNATVVIDTTVGAIVASRRPENPVGWLLCLFGIAVSTSSFASEYAIYALLTEPGSLPAGEALAWIAAWMLPIMISLQASYILLFPTGKLPSRRWRWLAWLILTFVVVGVSTSAFAPGAYLGSLGPIRNPLGIEGLTNVYRAVLFIMAPLLFIAAALSVFMRLRRARGVERQQIKWFAYAASAWAIGIISVSLINTTEAPLWFDRLGEAVFTAMSPVIPVAIGIAILRYRLYDIDRIINKTLVYSTLTAALAVVYFGSVVGLQQLLSPLFGESSQFAIVASTLAIAALFNPLRRRIQNFIDRRFYRKKYDAAKTLATFSTRLRDETDLELLREDLVSIVRETLEPARVSLWLAQPERGEKSLRGE